MLLSRCPPRIVGILALDQRQPSQCIATATSRCANSANPTAQPFVGEITATSRSGVHDPTRGVGAAIQRPQLGHRLVGGPARTVAGVPRAIVSVATIRTAIIPRMGGRTDLYLRSPASQRGP
jgi:hypothetical protein